MSSAAVDKRIESYRRLHIYASKSRLYVVGHDEQLGICRILKFRRQDGPRLDVVEDPIVYTPDQCNLVLRRVHEQSGGLQLICKGHGIIGCFRFTDSYYLLVVARREYVGHICGHKVYHIAETSLISLSASQLRVDNMAAADSTAEKRYRKLLLGMDLTRNFFFSYNYSLAHTLQHNHQQAAAATAAATAASAQGVPSSAERAAQSPAAAAAAPLDGNGGKVATAAAAAAIASGWDVYDSSMFVWNAYLTRPLRAAIQSSRWTLPLVHGYWEQHRVSIFGRHLTLTLLARRSRHFAGTRYRKRGVSAQGFVANEVETEQILDAGIDWATGQPVWSSMVQVRGSVPLFWTQQATPLSPKPDILLQQFDPVYEKTAAHFADLKRRYGEPIIALNLLKSREKRLREVLLRREFGTAVGLINTSLPPAQQVVYIPWDFQKYAKQPGANILVEINSIMSLCLDASGIYVHGPASCSSCRAGIAARFSTKTAAGTAAAANLTQNAAGAAAAADELGIQGVQSADSAAADAAKHSNGSAAADADSAAAAAETVAAAAAAAGDADLTAAAKQAACQLSAAAECNNSNAGYRHPEGITASPISGFSNSKTCITTSDDIHSVIDPARPSANPKPFESLEVPDVPTHTHQEQHLQLQQQQQQHGASTFASSNLVAAGGEAAAAAAHAGPKERYFTPQTQLQRGVLRTNCIDCLDRTNVVQFAYGLAAFGRQLSALGVSDEAGVDSDSSIAFQLMEMYEGMGHTLALQYGGSEAHAAFFQKKRGEWDATTQSRDLMTSIRRFYSNTYTDAEKQDAINLFLGNFVPVPNAPPIWELDSDYYLHTDAAIRYSQMVCAGPGRVPALPAAAVTAAAFRAATADTGTTATVKAGGRNAPVILRQLSLTTLPPSAFGFGCKVNSIAAADAANAAATTDGAVVAVVSASRLQASGSSSSNAGGMQQQAAASTQWTPFAAATSCNSAVVAAAAAAACSKSGGSVSTPLLPLTFSDGISVDASDTDGSPVASEGAFNFRVVFQQMMTEQNNAPLAFKQQQSNLISLDNVLARLPPAHPVRLYPVSNKNNIMWEAVQQAFAFFSSSDAAGASAGTDNVTTSAIIVSSSGSNRSNSDNDTLSQALASVRAAPQQTGSEAFWEAPEPVSPVRATNSLQQASKQHWQPHDGRSFHSSTPAGLDAVAAAAQQKIPSRNSSMSTQAAGTAVGPRQLLSSTSNLGSELRTPVGPAVSTLNDILEIRTDIMPVRLISQPDKPPQAIGPYGPVLPPRQRLDALLDDIMWNQYGINISAATAQPYTTRCSSGTAYTANSGGGASRGDGALAASNGLGFQTAQPGSPQAESPQGVTGRVFGVLRSSKAAGSSAVGNAKGNATLSPLNDIVQIGKSVHSGDSRAAASPVHTLPSKQSSSRAMFGSSKGFPTPSAAAAVEQHAKAAEAFRDSNINDHLVEQQKQKHDHAGRVTFCIAAAPAHNSVAAAVYARAAAVAVVAGCSAAGRHVTAAATSPSGADGSNSSKANTAIAAVGPETSKGSVISSVVENLTGDTTGAAAASYWNSSFRRRKQQKQMLEQLQLPGMLQGLPELVELLLSRQSSSATAAADSLLTSMQQEQLNLHHQQQQREHEWQQRFCDQQRQRRSQMHNMVAPVGPLVAAAALGFGPAMQSAAVPAVSVNGSAASVLAADVPQGEQEQDVQWYSGSSASSSSSDRQSSACFIGPTLQQWAADAENLGLGPELQAVWWGTGNMHKVWAMMHAASKESYAAAYRALLGLLQAERLSQTYSWYEQQMFCTPVVISTA